MKNFVLMLYLILGISVYAQDDDIPPPYIFCPPHNSINYDNVENFILPYTIEQTTISLDQLRAAGGDIVDSCGIKEISYFDKVDYLIFSELISITRTFIVIDSCNMVDTCRQYYGSGEVLGMDNWITDSIDGNTCIASMSIPGTHDSGTSKVNWFYSPYAKCQTLSIIGQLYSGIRFLDIRVSENLNIFHGDVYCNLSFEEVMNDCKAFLTAHPGEFILMSFKQDEFGDDLLYPKWMERWDSDLIFFRPFDNSRWPTVNEVKGKIVLFMRFDGVPWILGRTKEECIEIFFPDGYVRPNGYALTNFPDNCRVTKRSVVNFPELNYYVQDEYDRDLQQAYIKKGVVKQCLDSSINHFSTLIGSAYEPGAIIEPPADDGMYFNFVSMVGYYYGVPKPMSATYRMNPWLKTTLEDMGPGRYGCIIMDDPNPWLIRRVVRTNSKMIRDNKKFIERGLIGDGTDIPDNPQGQNKFNSR